MVNRNEGKLVMRDIHRIRRLGAALAGLAGCVAAFVITAPAAFATLPPPEDAPAPPPVQVHVVTAGGMPGWQITLIAIGAALVAAAAAVLLDRARLARRGAPVASS
jgi:hypothetical protein